MVYTTCVEEMEGQWIAHVPAQPGCFASATSCAAAVTALPGAIEAYQDWCRQNGEVSAGPEPRSTGTDLPVSVEVMETIREWSNPTDDNYLVNAFFAADAPPLTGEEVDRALRLLAWSRADLLATVEGLPAEILNHPVDGAWNISGILYHTGRAELWYLDQIDCAPEEPAPDDWRERLACGRAQLVEQLPGLIGVAQITFRRGEIWSPRKVLRRALWHERDHTAHIHQFRAALGC